MARLSSSLAAFWLASVALAVPAPEPFVSGWGKPVDPDRDCKIRRSNGVLTIEMPGACHEYDPTHNRVNAPRLCREFDGDFVIQVRVRIACRPSGESTLVGQPSFVAAGFVLISPDKFSFKWHYLKYRLADPGIRAYGSVIDMAQIFQDADGNYHNYDELDKRWRNWPSKSEPEHVYLRLERWGEVLSVSSSPDGKSWVSVGGGQHVGLPSKLKVGLAAYTTSKDPSKACFDQLKIIRGKRWERCGFVSGWGSPVDPDKDCKMQRDKDSLTIEMPGTDHDYDPVRKRFNAPRLHCELEGNFDLVVRVRIDSQPSAKSTVKGQPSFVSAGILLIYPDTHRSICGRIEYAASQHGSRLDAYADPPFLAKPRRNRPAPEGKEADSYAVMKTWGWGRGMPEQFGNRLWDRGWQNWPLAEKAEYAYLRLEQREEWACFFMSSDGQKWTPLEYLRSLPAKGKLGLAAYSTSTEPSKVIFDQLKLARDKKKER